MSSDGEEHVGIQFLKTLFGPSTTENVYVCSLANDKGDTKQPTERSISDRDAATLTTFVNRWNQGGRGCYFTPSTIKCGCRRQKPNAVETVALWVDIDFKSITEGSPVAEKRLTTLRYPPTWMVRSGHGLHAYWVFKEALPTQQYLERIEAALRQLADVLGGDLQVCHVVALMRLPGTHNTKGGASILVEHTGVSGRAYELDDLEEWLAEQSPVLKRKERPKPPEQNPYLAIAEKLGFKPPIDAEQRLAAMVYQGPGDSSIHDTQRAVTASLLSRGVPLEQVMTTVLDATRIAAGDYGARWNWAREEANIRRMCKTWLDKIEIEQHSSREVESESVVNLADARAARSKAQPGPVEKKGKKFQLVGEATLLGLRNRGEDLLFDDGIACHYAGGIWSFKTDHRAWINVQIERTCRALQIASDMRLISEARGWLERNPELSRKSASWDQHGMVPARNGLIDPLSFALSPATPEHYATWRVDCDFSPTASCPLWLQMLEDAFADRWREARAAVIATLQECLGAALLDGKSRGLRKALVLFGGPNSGKSELLAVLSGLFGEDVIAQPIAAVEGSHGLMPFQRRRPWVLNEAFNQNIWHMSDLVKTLITGEEVSINIKYGPMLRHRYTGPIFWATNHPPQFKESTRAIVERMVVIECRQSFQEGRMVGAAKQAHEAGFYCPSDLVLAHEKPGVLVWALEGLRRALDRHAISVGTESRAAAAQIYRDSNLVAGFVEECTEYDPDCRISLPDFCVAVACWFVENKGENRSTPSNESIGRALIALHDPRIVSDRYELRDNSARYLVGAKLNAHGLDYHERGVGADLFEGKTVNTTQSGGLVNKPVPGSWDVKPKVVAMRAAHRLHAEKTEKELSLGPDSSSVTKNECHDEPSSSEVSAPSKKPLF